MSKFEKIENMEGGHGGLLGGHINLATKPFFWPKKISKIEKIENHEKTKEKLIFYP